LGEITQAVVPSVFPLAFVMVRVSDAEGLGAYRFDFFIGIITILQL
jgi:hypothetical protein